MDRGEICDRFLDSVSFELYPFQEEALLAWFEVDGGLLVSAPTGMGKTLIAEAALFEALHTGRRLYYTTPLIALTEQKFREFQDKAEDWGFDRRDVGFITGNRKENPDARICVVVAEILLNHLLEEQQRLHDVGAVVMDEFHYFNEPERGIVWELSLVLLPPHIRLMLLSATVGNSVEFVHWLRKEHGRKVQVVQTDERRVPLEFEWVGDKLLTEHLPQMVEGDDAQRRSPALVFCFNRDECWEVAERIKGVKLIDQATRAQIEEHLDAEMFSQGAGPKLRQMLIRGVAVHHAGILPKYKEKVAKQIESDKYEVIPKVRKNEILSFLKTAKDISFSRPKSTLPWGISVPEDNNQIMYVWCDALSNYITGAGYGTDNKKFKQLWPADINMIGKDILRFYAAFCPAMLLSAKIPLQKQLFVHGFILSKGTKMGKSTGNIIDPFEQIKKYVPLVGQLAGVKRHVATQEAQTALRCSIAWWAGYQRAAGRSDSESYRRFWFKFDVDVMTAQTLKARDAIELAGRVNEHLGALANGN
ncbi:MAG: class I tRNA ligase family protein [Planctomycetes bacterium]|nr:class I tRNA ligase family protein [Planctomycetota bacterium]